MVLMTPFSKLKSRAAQRSRNTHFNFIWQHFNILHYDLQFYFHSISEASYMSTDRQMSKCKDFMITTYFFQENKKGLRGQLQSLQRIPIRLFQVKLMRTLPTHFLYPFAPTWSQNCTSNKMFQPKALRYTSNWEDGGEKRRRAEGDKERRREMTVLASSF